MLISGVFASGEMEFAKTLYAIMNSNQKLPKITTADF